MQALSTKANQNTLKNKILKFYKNSLFGGYFFIQIIVDIYLNKTYISKKEIQHER
jgi:hypothetical protein